MARLDRPPRRIGWPAWATAAAMAVLVAVAWLNPFHPRRPAITPTASSTPPVPAAPMASATPPPTPISAAAERPRSRRPLPAGPADPSVPPLPQPDPIAIAALTSPDIEIEPLSLNPLVVPHLAVEPLGEPEPERKD
jgi:hypothetical protein